jgi:hypothetical protein
LFLGSFFDPEDGGENVGGISTDYKALYLRNHHCENLNSYWEEKYPLFCGLTVSFQSMEETVIRYTLSVSTAKLMYRMFKQHAMKAYRGRGVVYVI